VILTGENRSTQRETWPVKTLCPPQIPHHIRTSDVGGRRLSAWALARPIALKKASLRPCRVFEKGLFFPLFILCWLLSSWKTYTVYAYAVLGAPLLAVPLLVTTVLESIRSYFMFLESTSNVAATCTHVRLRACILSHLEYKLRWQQCNGCCPPTVSRGGNTFRRQFQFVAVFPSSRSGIGLQRCGLGTFYSSLIS